MPLTQTQAEAIADIKARLATAAAQRPENSWAVRELRDYLRRLEALGIDAPD